MNQYRHEIKYQVHPMEFTIMEKKMSLVLRKDKNCRNNQGYFVKSVYFDDPYSRAYQEKVDGDLIRHKYRIRTYNNDFSTIKLERKSKNNKMTCKLGEPLSQMEVKWIFEGDYTFLKNKEAPLYQEFYTALTKKMIRPITVIEYERLPFVHPASDLRITFDRNLKCSYRISDFFSTDPLPHRIDKELIIMEIKFNYVLPTFIRSLIQTGNSMASATSKYIMSVNKASYIQHQFKNQEE